MKQLAIIIFLCAFGMSAFSADPPRMQCAVMRVYFRWDKDLKNIVVGPMGEDKARVMVEEGDSRRVRVAVESDDYAWFSFPIASNLVDLVDVGAVIDQLHKANTEESDLFPEVPIQELESRWNEILKPGSGVSGSSEQWRYIRDNTVVDEGPLGELSGMFGIYLAERDGGQPHFIPLEGLNKLSGKPLWLDVSNTSPVDLEEIGKLTQLRWLYASDKNMKTVAPLAGLKNLIAANFGNNKLVDLRSMSGMKALQRLYLGGNSVADISPLAALPALKGLDVTGNALRDLNSVRGLVRLEWLNLSGNPLENIDGLSALRSLSSLNLDGCGLTDLQPVARLTGLKWLQFAQNQVKSLAPLSGLTALEYLSAPENQIDNLSPVNTLAKLKALNLSHNQIQDPGPVQNLSGLEVLNLAHNQIELISTLGALKDLKGLYLSGNGIADIQALKSCKSLTHLDLSANNIQDISALEGLGKLKVLYLYQNQITDLSALIKNAQSGGLSQGATVWLSGNPLSEEAIKKQIPLLRARHKITLLF